MPGPVQDLACSAYGAIEQARRVGGPREARRIVANIDRLHRHPAEADARIVETLAAILRVARNLPGYAELKGTTQTDPLNELQSWTPLDKTHLRGSEESFLTRRPGFGDFLTTSSGTTGTPLAIWRPRTAFRQIMLSIAAFRRWHGVGLHPRRASFSGKVVVPEDSSRVWRLNVPGQQLLLSQYHIQPGLGHAYGAALERWKPSVLDGYASSLVALAGLLEDEVPSFSSPIKLTVTTAELISPAARRALGETFDAAVADMYSSSEHAVLAGQCESGERHIFSNVGLVEAVTPDLTPCADGEVGELLLTGLTNTLMPLIRYRVGDMGAVDRSPCRCGRSSPKLSVVAGRTDDMVIGPKGQRVAIFAFNILRHVKQPVEQLQITQYGPSRFRVSVHLDHTASIHNFEAEAASAFQALLGPDPARAIEFTYGDQLARTPGGKVRNVIVQM